MDYTIYWGYAALLIIGSFVAVQPWRLYQTSYKSWRQIKAAQKATAQASK